MPALQPGAGGEETFYPDYDYASDFFYPDAALRPFQIPSQRPAEVSLGIEDSINFVGSVAAGIFLPPLDVYGEEAPPSSSNGGSLDEWDEPNRQTHPVDFPETIFSPPFPNEDRPPIDWERVYDEYVVLNPESEVAIDWGDILGGALGSIATGLGAPQQNFGFVQTQPAVVTGPAPVIASLPAGGVVASSGGCCPSPGNGQPRYMRYCVATGTYSVIRRKRRKDLLTNGDFNNLMRIASLPNKETVKIALAAAIR